MFQQAAEDTNSMITVLENELESFNSVLQFSESFVKQVDTMPVSVLYNMVSYRQEWIDKIKKLEKQRKQFSKNKSVAEADTIIKAISIAAKKLVEIDKKIFKGLEERKLKFVQEHTQLAEHAHSNYKEKQGTSKQKPRLDIKQG